MDEDVLFEMRYSIDTPGPTPPSTPPQAVSVQTSLNEEQFNNKFYSSQAEPGSRPTTPANQSSRPVTPANQSSRPVTPANQRTTTPAADGPVKHDKDYNQEQKTPK